MNNSSLQKKIREGTLKKVHPKDAYLKGNPLAIPRFVNTKKPKPRGPSEATIQGAVENYLNMKGIKFIHIPDEVYMLCNQYSKYGRHIPAWIGAKIKEYLKSVPDLIIFKKEPDCIDNSCLMLELKKKNAKARKSQLNWHKGLTVHVVDNLDDALKLIREWER